MDTFKKEEVIPDVIDSEPQKLIEVDIRLNILFLLLLYLF